LLLAVLSTLGGCARGKANADRDTAPGAASGAPKVAFLLSTLQEERYQKDKKYFEAKAKTLGLEAFTLSADNDNARQLAQVEDALSRGAKVLVIQPTDSAAAASYVEKAHAKGAKVVAYDRAIKSSGLDAMVSHDSYKVGTLLAEAAIAATGGKGTFVLLEGQSGHSVALEIHRGIHAVLDPYIATGAVRVVLEKNHDAWSPEQALKSVEDAITKTKGDIQAIVAHNSGMARGAVQAVRAAGLGGNAEHPVFIGGADADAANVNDVCQGKQSVEVLKDIQPLAEKSAEVAWQMVGPGADAGVSNAGAEHGPLAIAVPVQLVTAQNAKQLLVESGFHRTDSVPACARN
jgi:D-xylose transport system substrate-binding protein